MVCSGLSHPCPAVPWGLIFSESWFCPGTISINIPPSYFLFPDHKTTVQSFTLLWKYYIMSPLWNNTCSKVHVSHEWIRLGWGQSRAWLLHKCRTMKWLEKQAKGSTAHTNIHRHLPPYVQVPQISTLKCKQWLSTRLHVRITWCLGPFPGDSVN